MQKIHGMELITFELAVARKYKHKVDNARQRGVDFSLTLAQFRNLMTRTKCAYTGLPITMHAGDAQGHMDLSIERIDATKGYVNGNCIAVCKAANSVKGVFEDPNTPLTVDDAIRMFSVISKLKAK